MDQIEEVLSKVDIVELINSYIPLKRAGRNFKALCPFHSEKTPSFIISPELQIFKCFGCQVGGNAIKFVSDYEKMTFGEALRFLAEKVGVRLTSYLPDKKQALKDRLYQINHLTCEFYHYILTKHKAGERAREYLGKRGVRGLRGERGESVEIFKLGYAPDAWENLFNFLVKKKGYKGEEVEKAGLIIKSQKSLRLRSGQAPVKSQKYYDRFRGRIIFPLFDHRGNIVGFSGRVLSETKKEAKYVNTPETLLYYKSENLYGLLQGKKAIKEKDGVILVEGEFDVLSSHQAGVKNIVAIKGTALTEGQARLLTRYTNNFNFCLDADLAGRQASRRGMEIVEALGINLRVINLPEGKDVDEFVRMRPGFWQKVSQKTTGIFDFYLESTVARFGKENAEAKKRISEEVLPIFNKITNEVVKAHFFKKLSQILEIPEEAVIREARRVAQKKKLAFVRKEPFKEKTVRTRREILEEYLLSLILQSADNFKALAKDVKKEYLATPIIKRIFSFLEKYGQKSTTLKIEKFVKIVPEELRETISRLFLFDLKGLQEDEQKLSKDWQKGWREVEKLFLHDKLGKLRGVLGDKKTNKEEKEKAEKEIMEIAKKLKG